MWNFLIIPYFWGVKGVFIGLGKAGSWQDNIAAVRIAGQKLQALSCDL